MIKRGRSFNHNLLKHQFLINFMAEDEEKPDEGEETVDEKAKELEKQQ